MGTWFYAAASDGSFPGVKYLTGQRILRRSSLYATRFIPSDWRDSNGGLTLVGVGFVLQMGRPVYIYRCAVSYHWLSGSHCDRESMAPAIDYETLAVRILADSGCRPRNMLALAAFLSLAPARLLLEDMHILMQEGKSRLDPLWLDFLAKGRQSCPLWDLRSGQMLSPRSPLILEDASRWPRRRRHHRSRPTA